MVPKTQSFHVVAWFVFDNEICGEIRGKKSERILTTQR